MRMLNLVGEYMVFQIVFRGGGEGGDFARGRLLGVGNLTRSEFSHLNIFQC